MENRVKITVLRREYYQDFADRYLKDPNVGKCPMFTEGQEFIVGEKDFETFPYENRFCKTAWEVFKWKIYSVMQGGELYRDGWMRNRREMVVCCDDGVRPVVFLLEALPAQDL